MSYPRDLDDYTTDELETELRIRAKYRAVELCEYCHRPYSTPPCKYPTRHKPAPERQP